MLLKKPAESTTSLFYDILKSAMISFLSPPDVTAQIRDPSDPSFIIVMSISLDA